MFERFELSLAQFAPKRLIAAVHLLGVIGAVFAAIAFIAGAGEGALLGLVPELLLIIVLRSVPWSAPDKDFVEVRDKSVLLQLHSLPWSTAIEVPYASLTSVEANAQHRDWLARRIPGARWREMPHVDLQFTGATVRWGPIPWLGGSRRRLHLFLADSDRFVSLLTDRIAAGGSRANTA
jgi:hypothetical protein